MAAQIAQLVVPSDSIGAPAYIVPDWPRGLLYFLNTAGVRTYSVALATQNPIRSVALTGITINAQPGLDPATGLLLIQGGFPGHAMSNTGPVFQLDPVTGAVDNWYGATSTLGSYPTALWVPESVVGIVCNGHTYAIVKEDAFSGDVDTVHISTPANHAGYHAVGLVSNDRNNRSYICVGGTTAFLTDSPNGPASFHVYKVTVAPGAELYNPATWPAINSDISSATLGPIAATAIDPAWSTVVPTGIAYDATDGNVIVGLTGNAGANRHYLAKINAASGAVMWQTAVDTTHATLTDYNVVRGAPGFIAGDGSFNAVATRNGTLTTAPLAGLSSVSNVRADESTGLIFLQTTLTAGAGAPVPVAGTPSNFTGYALLAGLLIPPDFPLYGVVKVLLPPAELQFCDAQGIPYAGGTLEFYAQGTSTPKDTWSDPAGTILNTNPLVLDSAGRAIIYGDGAYRTVLRDSAGNLIWDQPSFTYISACMVPVVGAPDLATARQAMGITDAIAAEAAARMAADSAEQTRAEAAEAALQVAINNEISRAEAAEAHLQHEIDTLPSPTPPSTVQSGAAALDSGGHAHVTFPTPFAHSATAVSVTPLEAGAYPVHMSVNINGATSFDAYACYAGTRTVWTGDFCWMAVGG